MENEMNDFYRHLDSENAMEADRKRLETYLRAQRETEKLMAECEARKAEREAERAKG